MRQNLIIALLSVCATLLAVNLIQGLKEPFPPALSQAVSQGGNFVVATGMDQSGSNAVVYILDTTSKRLACYSTRTQGIEFKGVRNISYDLMPDELIPRGRLTVAQMKSYVEKQGQGGGR